MSWFSVGRKKNKNGTSRSLTSAMLFPMQYNGATYCFDSFPDELIFIPYRDTTIPRHNPSNLFSNAKKLNHKFGITALLIHGNPKNKPRYFIILFHGNGVDLGMASAIWRCLIRSLPVHLLIVEYPGYGIMDGRSTCEQVTKVAQHAYSYVTRPKSEGGLEISTDKLIILGRSIGTGPAAHIATQKCHTLILVSPFTSIHNLSSDLMGKWTTWVLPKDFGSVVDQDDESDDESDVAYRPLVFTELHNMQRSVSEPYRAPCMNDEKEKELHMHYLHNYNKNEEPKQRSAFVFNNMAQIDRWKCQHLMLFHGKNDELIPCAHTETILEAVKKKKPELEAIKFLMNGVGHNDVNIQFIALRIFMQYQEELQSSCCEDTLNRDIDTLVPYLEDPPQFDRIKNKVQNSNAMPRRNLYKDTNAKQTNFQMINEWNPIQNKFNKYQRNLPTKIYDLALKLKKDGK